MYLLSFYVGICWVPMYLLGSYDLLGSYVFVGFLCICWVPMYLLGSYVFVGNLCICWVPMDLLGSYVCICWIPMYLLGSYVLIFLPSWYSLTLESKVFPFLLEEDLARISVPCQNIKQTTRGQDQTIIKQR
jgi:hypothetical protein